MSIKLLAGRYELLEKIGDGGMAIVYKARCRLLNRFVAIKILKPEYVTDPRILEDFRKESQAAAGLNHPNIVNIYDVGREGNVHYIVMELIEGKTLAKLIEDEGPMDYRKVIGITKQIASGLSFAHKNNIIHRDIKPQNILITADGTAKIADFGIAKVANEMSLSGPDGEEVIMGSVHYFSPEQARGGYIDSKSDIYSLGIVMFEMLTGNVPFDAATPVQVAVKHMNDPMPKIEDFVRGVPSRLETIVMKCTEKVSVNRYATADELIVDLDEFLKLSRIVGTAAIDPEHTDFDEKPVINNDKSDIKNERIKEKKKPANTKKRNIIIATAIAAVAVIVACVFIFGGGSEVKVPDLTGMTYEEAQKVLEDKDLKIEKGNEVFSDEYEEGQIVSQSPQPDMKVKKGKEIRVNISKGNGTNAVPNVLGMTKDEAQAAIEAAGFTLGNVDYEESESKENSVISQNPAGGTDFEAKGRIDIVIAKKIEVKTSRMPGLLGKTLDSAEAAIIDAGLSVGSITYGYSEDYPKGQVIEQQYKSGEELERGTSVDIKISKGAGSGSGSSNKDDNSGNDVPVEVE